MSQRDFAYKQAGVDIQAGNRFVSKIKPLVRETEIPGVLGSIGGFGGLFRPDLQGLKRPVLVGATDGVGTKLKLAFLFDCHDTIGIDLVAMSVNDIIVQGAKPLFFLDYFASGKLDEKKAVAVLRGIAEGCKQAGCALLGGETAEMPGFYAEGEYDLSGFCVGLGDEEKIVDGRQIQSGDVLIGLASSGIHSNGFSLVRKIFEKSALQANTLFPGTQLSTREVLLTPTEIYVQTILALLAKFRIKGMVHITGGGFYDNVNRILPPQTAARFQFGSWQILPVFDWLQKEGKLSWEEMLQIFNCGIGFVLVVSKKDRQMVCEYLQEIGQKAWTVGEIVEKKSQNPAVEIVF